jgi:EvpB/VC_A0108, tail sheath N-terminal domain
MNEKKSSIESFGVSLGSAPAPSPAAQRLEPWNVLICSDLGFKSSQPGRLRISDWKEFVGSKKITVSGTVENMLERDGKPFFLEYSVSSMQDFSAEAVLEKTGIVSSHARVYQALSKLISGACGEAEALQAVENSGLTHSEKTRIRSMLGGGGTKSPASEKPQSKSPRSGIDKILSMVDFEENQSGEKPDNLAQSASDAFIETMAAGTGPSFQKGALKVYVDELGKKLHEQVTAIQMQPFFASRKASWQCLMDCARAIGRKTEIGLTVFSAPPEDMEEKFRGVLEHCIESFMVPDIIVWDFSVSFSNADMDLLTKIAETADQYKCALLAPLSMDDGFFEGLSRLDSLSPLFEDVRFLPFKKLRANPASRCVCLCAPDMVFPGKERSAGSRDIMITACGCWALLERWIESMLYASDPFATVALTVEDNKLLEDAVFSENIPPHLSKEASKTGITLFDKSPAAMTFDGAVAVIDSESAGAAYSSLAFNVLVNRVARLSVTRLSFFASHKSKEAAAKDLCEFLQKELTPYLVLSSPDQVSVSIGKEGEIELVVNSDVKVSGFPAQFSFSLNL